MDRQIKAGVEGVSYEAIINNNNVNRSVDLFDDKSSKLDMVFMN